jgi:hypothetical protein
MYDHFTGTLSWRSEGYNMQLFFFFSIIVSHKNIKAGSIMAYYNLTYDKTTASFVSSCTILLL